MKFKVRARGKGNMQQIITGSEQSGVFVCVEGELFNIEITGGSPHFQQEVYDISLVERLNKNKRHPIATIEDSTIVTPHIKLGNSFLTNPIKKEVTKKLPLQEQKNIVLNFNLSTNDEYSQRVLEMIKQLPHRR